jgi:hypothetical protein
MSVSIQFYLDQAAKCASEAREAKLPNRREVLVRAQASWTEMADRALRVAAERDKRDAERRLLPSGIDPANFDPEHAIAAGLPGVS